MNIPDCYDPVYQAEQREREYDRVQALLPKCCFCEQRIQPGQPYREYLALQVCGPCFEELKESIQVVDFDY